MRKWCKWCDATSISDGIFSGKDTFSTSAIFHPIIIFLVTFHFCRRFFCLIFVLKQIGAPCTVNVLLWDPKFGITINV